MNDEMTNTMPWVVAGLAKSGLAAALRLLAEGHAVRVTDIRPRGELVEELATLEAAAGGRGLLLVAVGEHPLSLLDGACAVVLSPGIPKTIPFIQEALRRGVPVWSEIEFAFRRLKGIVIGITGSNGKSTTTALTAHILCAAGVKAFATGNIGTPLSGLLHEDSEQTVYVTELSSFQLESMDTFRPRIGTILNVTPDHLDRYASMEEYETAKWNIFKNMSGRDNAVLNARDDRLARGCLRLNCACHFFDAQPVASPEFIKGAGVFGEDVWLNIGGEPQQVMKKDDIPLPGPHNLENVLAASLLCGLAGLTAGQIAAGVKSFRALAHRLEPVGEIDGRLFVNDSKATNVDSTCLALRSFDRPVVVILGGKDKGSPYTPIQELAKDRVRHAILIGKAAPLIAECLGGTVPLTSCPTLEEAVKRGYELSQPGDVVLLSPACASYDMFDNFEHRGEVFRNAVEALKASINRSGEAHA